MALDSIPRASAGNLLSDRCLAARVVHAGDAAEIIHWRCLHDTDVARRERVHVNHVLTFSLHGASSLKTDRGDVTVDPVTATFHRPGSSYRTRHPWGCNDSGISIAFRRDVADDVLARVDPRGDGPLMTVAVKPLRLALEHMIAALRRRDGRAIDPIMMDERAIELLRAVLAPCARRADAARAVTRAEHRAVVDDAREYLRENYQASIRLDEVARAVGASPFHLCRVFRRETGLTMRAYLHRLRLGAAAYTLTESGDSLARIALDTGFCSHSHLTALFTRETGLAPADVRRRIAAA